MKPIFFTLAAILLLIGCQKGDSVSSSGVSDSKTAPKPGHTDSLRRTFHLDTLERVTLKANGHEIPAWVMDTGPKEAEGMMWLVDSNVQADEGMLFVFKEAKKQSFWMENTILPLDIIFISDKYRVVNVQQGKPYDESPLPSSGPAMYVLEMKQGAAKRLGIGPGVEISIPSGVKAK